MLHFINDSYDMTLAYSASYNLFLVIASYLVACLAAYTAWTMAEHIKSSQDHQILWHTGGSIAMGCGIWCMHFVGMLAFKLPVAVAYDPWITLASILPAVLASWVTISQFSQAQMKFSKVLVSALFMGAGIGAMHYIGMAAMLVGAIMAYDLGLFILSVVVAILLAFIALAVKYFYLKMAHSTLRNWYKLSSVMIMGLAISGMHYTAMAAVYYFPGNSHIEASQSLPTETLSLMVIAFSVLIILLTLIAAFIERKVRNISVNLDTSRKRMLDAIESISEGFVMFDSNDFLVMANSVYHDMYPELQNMITPGVHYKELLKESANQKNSNLKSINKKLDWHNNSDKAFEETVSDGRKFIGRECKSLLGDSIGVWSDISEIKKVQDKLVAQKKQLRQTLNISPVAIFIGDLATEDILYTNAVGQKINQQLKLDLLSDSACAEQFGEEYQRLKALTVEKGNIYDHEVNIFVNGESISVLVSATTIEFKNKVSILFTLVDISERKAVEEQIRKTAITDSLTQLYNRRHFIEQASEQINRCKRNNLPLCIFMLDIDLFKPINDSYGHATGDEVIKSVAQSIKNTARDVDLVGRLGGEEFAVLLADKDQDSIVLVADRIRKAVAELHFDKPHGGTFKVTISIGISSLKERDLNENELLNEADIALYQAKNGGRNRCCVYQV